MDTSVAQLEVTDTEVDGFAAIAVAGELDASTCNKLAFALAMALRRGGPIVLDLGRCTFIDSKAVAVIVQAVRPRKGGLVICNANRFVARVLNASGLDGMPGVQRGYKDTALIGINGADR
jgi:anti-anti-sigma factor